jgi:hypothetical protein
MKTYKEMCDELPVKKGDLVLIELDSLIYTTHPVSQKISKKSWYLVKVHAAYPAFHDDPGGYESPAQVHWAGTGGYWHWTDMKNIKEIRNDHYRNGLLQEWKAKENG